MMRKLGLEPRTLADDLFLFAEGPQHASNAVRGMKVSREYFKDIGAKVADKKCFMSSTCPHVLSAALYGSEVAPLNQKALSGLRSAIVDAIGCVGFLQ